MKPLELFSTLLLISFYTAIPLLIPAAYAYYSDEASFTPISHVILVLMAPSIPALLPGLFSWIADKFNHVILLLFRREAPWNFALSSFTKRPNITNLRFGEILAVSALAWIIIPLVASYPYYMAGMSITDSLFESMSGWTSTGLSVMASPNVTLEQVPQSLILYRSVTQWIGGLGIILLMLALFKHRQARKLLAFEGKNSLDIGTASTAKKYWLIYTFLSILAIGALYLSGFDIFNSVNLAFAGLSNGGYFPFSGYDFVLVQKFILAGTMFAGAISFMTYNKLFSGRLLAFLSEEFFLLLSLIIISTLLIFYISHDDLNNSFLNIISSIASGGFAIGDLSVMHEFSKYVLIILMVCGGMYASTSGGLKLWRILVALKLVWKRIRSYFLPEGAVQVVQVDKNPVDEQIITDVLAFIFMYLLILIIASGVFMAWDFGIVDSLFTVASSLGNVGLSTIDMATIPVHAKGFIIILMYIGRIEIVPVLALIRFILPRSY